MCHIILMVNEKYRNIISRNFQHNYPDYNIDFINSKELPANCIQKEKTVWICDSDQQIRALSESFRHQAGGDTPLPLIAISHEDNRNESLMGAPTLILSPDGLTPELINTALCRYEGIPVTIVCSDRLRVRELTLSDLAALLDLQEENKNNPGGCFFPEGCAAPDQYLEQYIRYQYQFYGYGLFAVCRRSDDQFLGIAGYCLPGEMTSDRADALISYGLLKSYHHMGYAREAVGLLLKEGSRRWDLSRILAEISPHNQTSLKLARDLGIPYISL